MAFRKKSEFIQEYKPDILIVPECEHPDRLKFNKNCLQPTDIYWYGSNLNKGLGVFSFTNFKITKLDFHEEQYRLIVPLKITNEESHYTVFAIWANNPQDPDFQYVGQTWKALNHYKNRIKLENTLLVGDFNSNSIWDKPRRLHNHKTIVEILAERQIESVYHKYFEQEQGKEKHPTLFMYRHRDKPYHIDYCFASMDLIKKLKKVEVGEYEKWIKWSDHMPLIVEFE